MSSKRLVREWWRWRRKQVPLALATVVETAGSTYTKPGHRILIAADGDFQGLVSGGCLEGDLAAHARSVIETGTPQLLTYDMRGENDELFGLGAGCHGMFRVLLQRLDPAAGYEPFAALAACMLGSRRRPCAVVIESNASEAPPGATLLVDLRKNFTWQLEGPWMETVRRTAVELVTGSAAFDRVHEHGSGRIRVLYTSVAPLPRLLVLGAGPDAPPLVEIANRLGWRVTVLDHRPAYLERSDLRGAERTKLVEPAKLAATVKLGRYDAAVVMSHHLATDRAYLAQLAASPIPYIGLLGPAVRRDRLLADLGATAAQLRSRLHAPVGLPIGANTPESIALAIAAELHATVSAESTGTAAATAV
jgi:xanthine/CO dehydrogenase XdhC/CoxF family maturation factor